RQKKVLVIGDPHLKLLLPDKGNWEIWGYRKGLIWLLQAWRRLCGYQFAVAFNCSYQMRSVHLWLGWLMNAQDKWTFRLSNANRQNVWEEVGSYDLMTTPMWMRYQSFLDRLSGAEAEGAGGGVKNQVAYRYDLSWLVASSNRSLAQGVVINIQGGSRERTFHLRTVEYLVRQFRKQGVTVVGLIVTDDNRVLVANHFKRLDLPVLLNPSSYLPDTIRWVTQFATLVTPDTAWVHIGSALGLEVVVYYLFDPEAKEINHSIWRPHGTRFRIYLIPKAHNQVFYEGILPEHVLRAQEEGSITEDCIT
ncbi:MAG: hypothetical protein NZ480_07905, partial [Bdellovibrionaceae bacterium]|nr:hypothetical protein [Pseudobdellovibrionaceae bacterium]